MRRLKGGSKKKAKKIAKKFGWKAREFVLLQPVSEGSKMRPEGMGKKKD
jgi:hypothetical protein